MKTRRRKILLTILFSSVVLITAAALLIPRFLDLNRYNTMIVSELQKVLGGKVRLGHIRWSIKEDIRIEIEGFSVTNNTAFPVDFNIPHLSGEISILPLLSKKVIIEELWVSQPRISVRLGGAAPQDSVLSPTGHETAKSGPMFEVLIQKFHLQEGRVTLEDRLTLPGQKVVYNFQDAFLEGFDILSREMTFALSMRDEAETGLGRIKADATFIGLTKTFDTENPRLILQARLPDLNVDVVSAYLKNTFAENLDGNCSLKLNCESDFGELLRFNGTLGLIRLTCTNPSLWESPLILDETTLHYDLRLDHGNLAVDQLEIDRGNLTLSAQALVTDWSIEPLLKETVFKGSFPLKEIIPLVPWGKPIENAESIRNLLEGGGLVSIEKVAFPEISFTKELDPGSVFFGLNGTARLSGLSMSVTEDRLLFEDIGGSVTIENGVLKIDELSSRLGEIRLPGITAEITDLFGHPEIIARTEGSLSLGDNADKETLKLLKKAGIEKMQGTMDLDLGLRLDTNKPEDYQLHGTVELRDYKLVTSYSTAFLEGLNAHITISPETAEVTKCFSSVVLPAGGDAPGGIFSLELVGRVDNLRGKVSLVRKDGLDVSISDLSGYVNQAPFRVSGQLTKVGTPQMLIDVDAAAKQLDLRDVAALIGPLKELDLTGTLDMDMDIYIPYSDPRQTRLNGKAKLKGFGIGLLDQKIIIRNGNAESVLEGDLVRFRDMTFFVNDQQVRLSGQMRNPVEPDIFLEMTSPYLDLDRLIPKNKVPREGTGTDTPKEKLMDTSEDKESFDITAQVKVDVRKGQFRDQEFRNLEVTADYEKGLVRSFTAAMEVGEGEIQATGTADLRDPNKTGFVLEPNINNVNLERLAPLFIAKTPAVYGPLTLSGRLEGVCADVGEPAACLHGNLKLNLGPGRVTALGPVGGMLAKILRFLNVNIVRVGTLVDDLRGEGIQYKEIKGEISFDGGEANVKELFFDSSALDLVSHGTVDLINRQLDLEAEVQLFHTVDKALGLVPLFGKTLSHMTKIYLTLKNSWTDPKIGSAQTKMVTQPVRDILNAPKEMLKGMGSGNN